MKNIIWPTCLLLCYFVLSVFSGNYTYYAGFAYTNNNSILTNSISQTNNQSINSCVCQCLLTNGCSALTFYNGSDTCFLINDTMINENEVSLNNTALLLLVNASLNTTS